MQKKVLDFIRQHHMISGGDRIVAGVSGGADSVCLFYILCRLQEQIPFTFAVVHVNHMLRGEEAEADERFVQDLCQRHGITCRVCREDVAGIAGREKMSLEEAGRRVRYEAFERFSREWGANKTALAHHQNDCAETMLYHLARGTGIRGLCSLRPVRNSVIRPLLCMNRAEIEQYLKEEKIEYRTDSTNMDEEYTRNKIRHRVIPYLTEEINPRTVEHMAATAQSLEEVQDYLDEMTEMLMEKYVQKSGDSLLADNQLAHEPLLLQKYVLQKCLEQSAGTKKDFTRVHLEEICALFARETGKCLHLPYSLVGTRTYRGLAFRGADIREQSGKLPAFFCEQLKIPGDTRIEKWTVQCALLRNSMQRIPQKTYTKWLDYDRIKDTLVIRTRLPGDYIRINEEGGRKKIKDYFIDLKIPREERDKILLLAAGSEVLWVVGHRISQACMVRDSTECILRIQIKGGNIHE